MTVLASEAFITALAVLTVLVAVGGLATAAFFTVPLAYRGYRKVPRNTPEREFARYQYYQAIVGLVQMSLLVGVGVAILLTEPGELRSAIARPLLFSLVVLVAYVQLTIVMARKRVSRAASRVSSIEDVAKDTNKRVRRIEGRYKEEEDQ